MINRKSSIFLFLLVCLLFCSATPFIGGQYWIFDLLTSFPFQYLFIGLIFLICSFFFKRLRLFKITLSFFVIILNLAHLSGAYGFPSEGANPGEVKIKLISANLLKHNDNYLDFIGYVEDASPDILVLVEYTDKWHSALETLNQKYTHNVLYPKYGSWGLGVFSKYPIVEELKLQEFDREPSALYVRIAGPEVEFDLFAIHPVPPVNVRTKRMRNRYFNFLLKNIKSDSREKLFCGDFNLTPWSPIFTEFERSSKALQPKGFGYLKSWPAFLPSFFHIPIDHCLVSKGVSVSSYKKGVYFGSDHYPIELVFSIESKK